jgi:hypothetical protein
MYKILVGKPEGKRPFVRSRCRWEDKTKMDRRKIGSKGVDWIHVFEVRDLWWALANMILNLQDP